MSASKAFVSNTDLWTEPPPLTQSMYETMACPASYQAIYIRGAKQVPGELALLSQEEHDLMWAYVSHLREENLEEDWPFFESLLSAISVEAQEVVRGFIGSLKFNPRSILTTEIRFEFADASGKPDLVTLESPTDATIWDYKNYFDIIEPTTFQSKLYPLLLFRHNPNLETVRFVLVFMRYGRTREITWTRDHVPYLERILAVARVKQAEIHDTRGTAQAIPGRACDYCPLLGTRKCPVDQWNPLVAMNDSERLLYVVYLRANLNKQVAMLRQHSRDKRIEAMDGNGNLYTCGYTLHQKRTLPLNPTLQVLQQHFTETGEDLSQRTNVSKTSLASMRAAKKRAKLDQALTAIESVKETTEFGISRVNPDEAHNNDDKDGDK